MPISAVTDAMAAADAARRQMMSLATSPGFGLYNFNAVDLSTSSSVSMLHLVAEKDYSKTAHLAHGLKAPGFNP